MGEEISEYEMFRLQRLKGSADEDKNSAHFSMKDSNLDFSDRLELVSSRSSPHGGAIQVEADLFKQAKHYDELLEMYEILQTNYNDLSQRYEKAKDDLEKSEAQKQLLKQALAKRKLTEKATKQKLKQWVYEVKKGFYQQ